MSELSPQARVLDSTLNYLQGYISDPNPVALKEMLADDMSGFLRRNEGYANEVVAEDMPRTWAVRHHLIADCFHIQNIQVTVTNHLSAYVSLRYLKDFVPVEGVEKQISASVTDNVRIVFTSVEDGTLKISRLEHSFSIESNATEEERAKIIHYSTILDINAPVNMKASPTMKSATATMRYVQSRFATLPKQAEQIEETLTPDFKERIKRNDEKTEVRKRSKALQTYAKFLKMLKFSGDFSLSITPKDGRSELTLHSSQRFEPESTDPIEGSVDDYVKFQIQGDQIRRVRRHYEPQHNASAEQIQVAMDELHSRVVSAGSSS